MRASFSQQPMYNPYACHPQLADLRYRDLAFTGYVNNVNDQYDLQSAMQSMQISPMPPSPPQIVASPHVVYPSLHAATPTGIPSASASPYNPYVNLMHSPEVLAPSPLYGSPQQWCGDIWPTSDGASSSSGNSPSGYPSMYAINTFADPAVQPVIDSSNALQLQPIPYDNVASTYSSPTDVDGDDLIAQWTNL